MRSYIFTEHERKLVRRLLAGERDDPIWKLMHRIKTFKALQGDIELYRKASAAVATKKQLSAL